MYTNDWFQNYYVRRNYKGGLMAPRKGEDKSTVFGSIFDFGLPGDEITWDTDPDGTQVAVITYTLFLLIRSGDRSFITNDDLVIFSNYVQQNINAVWNKQNSFPDPTNNNQPTRISCNVQVYPTFEVNVSGSGIPGIRRSYYALSSLNPTSVWNNIGGISPDGSRKATINNPTIPIGSFNNISFVGNIPNQTPTIETNANNLDIIRIFPPERTVDRDTSDTGILTYFTNTLRPNLLPGEAVIFVGKGGRSHILAGNNASGLGLGYFNIDRLPTSWGGWNIGDPLPLNLGINKQDVLSAQNIPGGPDPNMPAHEFGHLLGLDDRYHYYQAYQENSSEIEILGFDSTGNMVSHLDIPLRLRWINPPGDIPRAAHNRIVNLPITNPLPSSPNPTIGISPQIYPISADSNPPIIQQVIPKSENFYRYTLDHAQIDLFLQLIWKNISQNNSLGGSNYPLIAPALMLTLGNNGSNGALPKIISVNDISNPVSATDFLREPFWNILRFGEFASQPLYGTAPIPPPGNTPNPIPTPSPIFGGPVISQANLAERYRGRFSNLQTIGIPQNRQNDFDAIIEKANSKISWLLDLFAILYSPRTGGTPLTSQSIFTVRQLGARILALLVRRNAQRAGEWFESVPMFLPASYDPNYLPNDNLMSFQSETLTNLQLQIVSGLNGSPEQIPEQFSQTTFFGKLPVSKISNGMSVTIMDQVWNSGSAIANPGTLNQRGISLPVPIFRERNKVSFRDRIVRSLTNGASILDEHELSDFQASSNNNFSHIADSIKGIYNPLSSKGNKVGKRIFRYKPVLELPSFHFHYDKNMPIDRPHQEFSINATFVQMPYDS